MWKLKLNARLKLFLWKIAWNIIPSKARLKSVFYISFDDSLSPLCNMEERGDFSTHFSDVALQGLLGDPHFGLLIPKPGALFPYLDGFKASFLLMLFLAFQKVMFTSLRFLPLFFVIGYGFAGTRPFMMESFQISLNLLFPSRNQLWLMQQLGVQFLLKKSKLGFHLWKVTSSSTLIQQSETTSQLKLQSAKIIQALLLKLLLRFLPLLLEPW